MSSLLQVQVQAVLNASHGPGVYGVHGIRTELDPKSVCQGEDGIVLGVPLVDEPLGSQAHLLAQAVPNRQRRHPPFTPGAHVAYVVGLTAVGCEGGHFAWANACGVEEVGQALSRFHLSRVHHETVPNHPKAVRGIGDRRRSKTPQSAVAVTTRGPSQEQYPEHRRGDCAPKGCHESWPNTSFNTHPLPHSFSSASLQCSGKNTRFWNRGGRYFCQLVPPVAARSTGSLCRYLTALL